METRTATLVRKTRIFAVIVILTNVIGNLLLGMGLHRIGSLVGHSLVDYIAALAQPLVAAGVGLLIVWMITHMMLLSWADLSFVVPVTSVGYVLTAVVGRLFLHETVSWVRWLGIWLIVFGVMLVSRTQSATYRREETTP